MYKTLRGYLKPLLMAGPRPLMEWAKSCNALLPDLWKYGKPYREILSLLQESDGWDEQALFTYQERLLRDLMHHCYTNTTYYRNLFQEAGLTPDDINTVQDLKKLPYLTKEIVRNNKADLKARNISSFTTDLVETGGSTGAPLIFLMNLTTIAVERALMLRHLKWLGWEKGDVVAEIKSDHYINPNRLYHYSPLVKVLRFGTLRFDSNHLEKIVNVLQKFRPAFIKIYPSSLCVLSRWMKRHGKSIDSIKYIITSSEILYPFIKEVAEEAFKVPVIDYYGQAEEVALAFQCSAGLGYHIQMEHSLMELIPVKNEGWEIVGTSLHNFAMPFVRYRTGDLATKLDEPCPCGHRHPLISGIQGRHGDIVVTPEGNMVSVVVMAEAFDDVESVKEGQVIQEEIDVLRLKVVPWDHITREDKKKLLKNFQESLASPRMKVIWEEVEEIPRTARGKRPLVVSRIDLCRHL